MNEQRNEKGNASREAHKVALLQLLSSVLTIGFISLPIFFFISINSWFSFDEFVAATSNPKILGAYLFINIAVASIWVPLFLFSSQKKILDNHIGFGFINQLFITLSLCFLLFFSMFSGFLYGISLTDPADIKVTAIQVARGASLTIIIHFYLDIVLAIKTRELYRKFRIL